MTMQRESVRTTPYRITQNDDNVTTTAGTPGQRSRIARFTTPARTKYLIRPGDIFSLFLANAGGTQVADSSVVELVKVDPNNILSDTLVNVDYAVVKAFADRNELYTLGMRLKLQQDDRLEIHTNANLTVATPATRWQISTVRAAEVTL